MESKIPPTKKRPSYSHEVIKDCLRILKSGDIEELFEIIPRIGVLRDPSFNGPLCALLEDEEVKKREFAAYAMGATGSREFLEPLKQAFLEAEKMKGFGARELQIAVIEAIGALGDDAAVEFFLPVLQSKSMQGGKKFAIWIVESLGTIAQQGGNKSVSALMELTGHQDAEIAAQAISELSVAYWHRPNEVSESMIRRLLELAQAHRPAVSESALSALQSLADVGCRSAEKCFSQRSRR